MGDIYACHLEGPGTKAFSESEARAMLSSFLSVDIRIGFGRGDLLSGAGGQRHRGVLLRVGKALWPRWLVRSALKKYRSEMFITVLKPRPSGSSAP